MNTPTAQDVADLHAAYCLITRQVMRLNMAAERYWFEAAKAGLTPQDLMAVIRQRNKEIYKKNRRPQCILLRNICGSDEAILDVLNEAAAIRALGRKPSFPPAKSDALRATGRSGSPPPSPERTAGEVVVDCLKRLKEAAQ